MTRLLALLSLALFTGLAAPALRAVTSVADTPALHASATLPKLQIHVADKRIRVEIADTPATRETGLMNRFSIAPDEGMLFVFAQPRSQAFWMHNTYMPLSIAFIDAGGRVINIEDMAPQTDDTHLSRGAALYALEMRQGWFSRNDIAAGAKVTGLPKPSRE